MTQKQIQYFLKTAEKKSIAAAASELYVSRSVVSRSILELEEEIGESLFTRSKEGVEPTEAGKLLEHMFLEFEAGYSNTLERIHSLGSDNKSRVLRLGLTPTSSLKLCDMLYQGFLSEHPDVRLIVTERPAHEVLGLLFDREADAVFTPSREELSASFGTMAIYQSRIVMGMSYSNPLSKKPVLTISDILDQPLGYLEAPMPFEKILINCFAAFGKEPNVVIRSSQLGFLRRLAEDGHIATILPGDMIEDWNNVAAVPLDFFSTSTHRLVWDQMKRHNSAFDDFIAFVKKWKESWPNRMQECVADEKG